MCPINLIIYILFFIFFVLWRPFHFLTVFMFYIIVFCFCRFPLKKEKKSIILRIKIITNNYTELFLSSSFFVNSNNMQFMQLKYNILLCFRIWNSHWPVCTGPPLMEAIAMFLRQFYYLHKMLRCNLPIFSLCTYKFCIRVDNNKLSNRNDLGHPTIISIDRFSFRIFRIDFFSPIFHPREYVR